MANVIKKIYEIQDIGKGIITTITEDNLLLLKDNSQGVQGLQNVITTDNVLDIDNTITVNQQLIIRANNGGDGANITGIHISDDSSASSTVPNARIGKGVGNNATDVSLSFFPTNVIFRDSLNSKGLEYFGDYEANFTDRSLITKQFYEDNLPTVDGSETKVTAGTNITVTGLGTTATPYIINSTGADGSETKINAGTNISVTGTGTIGAPYVIDNTLVVDGSETKLNSGTSTIVAGNGTLATPYTVETVNLQKAITTDYTLLAIDNNYSIKVNNGVTPITITVPAGLPENFFAGVTQKGTANVTFVASGTTLVNPIGLKIKGQGYYVGVEQIGTTNTFDILGNTQA